jgi:hypothetical protein
MMHTLWMSTDIVLHPMIPRLTFSVRKCQASFSPPFITPVMPSITSCRNLRGGIVHLYSLEQRYAGEKLDQTGQICSGLKVSELTATNTDSDKTDLHNRELVCRGYVMICCHKQKAITIAGSNKDCTGLTSLNHVY